MKITSTSVMTAAGIPAVIQTKLFQNKSLEYYHIKCLSLSSLEAYLV
jgi:hypothetical protein